MTTRSRRAVWLFTLCMVGLFASLFALALAQSAQRQATRGVGPALPEPIEHAAVSPLCVNVALQIYQPDLRSTLDRIAGAGLVWLRQTFPWSAIEPARGVYNWEPWDTLVNTVASHPANFQLIAVIDTAPAWASGGDPAAPPTDPHDLARFAGLLAARYGDQIDFYQVWDEPNLSSRWGQRDVDPAAYSALLQAAAEAIRAADAGAVVILAGLAPTVETGPRNLSDVRYLRALYELGTAPYFDIVAGKPYGIEAHESIGEEFLNFSRLVLLREEMVAHGDAHKALWASHWGWNALPPGWTGQPSSWGQTDPQTQAELTVAALDRARREWPWSGALCLENWQPDAPDDDAHWGFALISQNGAPRPVYQALQEWASAPATNPPGYYPATTYDDAASGVAEYRGEWRFSELGADVTEAGGQSVLIPFEGTDLGLRVRQGDYRAYFFVRIDGQPANALPRDENGAYLVLTSPDQQPQVRTIPVARGLADGPHVAEITVQRGWGQWPLVGWSVGWRPHADEQRQRLLTTALGLAALACCVGLAWSARQIQWRWAARALHAAYKGLNDAAQIAITASVTLVFWANAWLTWGQERAAGRGGLAAAIAAATLFYVSPAFVLSLFSLGLLAVLVVLRLDLGLALVAFAAPFYLQSRAMFDQAFSVVEIAVLLCFISWVGGGIRELGNWGIRRGTRNTKHVTRNTKHVTLDWGVLFFVGISLASVFTAELRGVALREFRIVVLEPALFYVMLRTSALSRRARWRIVDAFVLGAVGVALVGLYQYAFTSDIITAEAGLRRLKSVYGSPNNVGLYLGRALPLLAAVALLGQNRRRRWLYGAGALLVGLAILLSFSKGALLFGAPASLLALGLLAGGRWPWAALGALGAAALGAVPLLRTPRFTSIFDLQSGTSFFRLNLWRSSLAMIQDHFWLGVGPDNFLYAYRGRYIRPAAWQEPNLSHPHNVVLDYFSRLGVLGLAAGLWLQAAFWRLALPLRRLAHPDERALALGLMCSMVDFLAHGLVDNSYFLVDLAFAFCLTLALTAHLAQDKSAP